MIRRRSRPLSLLLLLAFALSMVSDGQAADARRPNILFVLADDHTSQAWGCYRGRLADVAPTPNIDRIAREGARLANCFCTNSICVPSRAAILTGQYSHASGVKTLRDGLDPKADHVARRLRQAGYHTALVGKWHLKNPPTGFDYFHVIKGQGRYHDPVMFENEFTDSTRGRVRKGYCTDVFTDEALGWLEERDSGKPFCLMLHFKATHEPWQYADRHAGLYRDETLPEPETLPGRVGPENSVVPGWPLEILTRRMTKRSVYGGGKLELETDEPAEVRRATYQKLAKDFLRCVAGIDENVGRVLDYLDDRGLARDTVIAYTSDQGYFLGEHAYFDKRFMLEESLRMPFVVRYPREIPAGSVVEDIVLNIDFAPTFLDWADAKASESMQGHSFRENLKGQTPDGWRRSMYYRYFQDSEPRPSHYGIRTHEHKLIYYDGLTDAPPAGRWEFYDLIDDPRETRNAIDDAKYADVITSLKDQLRRRQAELGDRP